MTLDIEPTSTQAITQRPVARPCRVLVAGLGSSFGWDRLGWLTAERLSEKLSNISVVLQARVRTLRSPGELLDYLEDVDQLHVIDACRATDEIGKVHACIWPASEIRQMVFTGTHDMGLADVLLLAQTLALLPANVTIWGINVGDLPNELKWETPISNSLLASVESVSDKILRELSVP